MAGEVLTWEITPTEQREHIEMFILKSWPILIGLVLFSLIHYSSNFVNWALDEGAKAAIGKVIAIVVGVTVCVWLFFLLNKVIPYRKRTYRLDDAGIEITKGAKKRYFLWNEFEYFYPYRSLKTNSNKRKNSA